MPLGFLAFFAFLPAFLALPPFFPFPFPFLSDPEDELLELLLEDEELLLELEELELLEEDEELLLELEELDELEELELLLFTSTSARSCSSEAGRSSQFSSVCARALLSSIFSRRPSSSTAIAVVSLAKIAANAKAE